MTDLEKRELWKRRCVQYAIDGEYQKCLELMAQNVADNGNIYNLVYCFCENADPSPEVFGHGQAEKGRPA